ncbi:MAG: glycosyltransferase, partial [Chlamydiota bacterium]
RSVFMLVLMTHNYPYGEGETFIEQELPYLLEEFPLIYIIPLFSQGKAKAVPEGVTILQMPVEKIFRKLYRSLIEPNTYTEIMRHPGTLLSLSKMKYLLGYTSYCNKLYHFLHSEIKKQAEWRNALFYTYWFHVQASALAQLKINHFPELKIVSRAHGYDLYEEEYWPGYIPMREKTSSAFNHLFTVSEDGKRHLSQKFHREKLPLSVAKLGTEQPEHQAAPSKKCHLTIVSCSHMVPEKRIERIIDAIAFLPKICDMQVSWNHLGGGPLYENLYDLAESVIPSCVDWKIHGKMDNSQILRYYQNHPVDVFLSTSRTEGIPVSMMEAASCGIPLVATNVGGVREIVCEKNGVLIEKKANTKEIAEAIIEAKNKSKRKASFMKWQTHFSGKKNYQTFAKSLKSIHIQTIL